MIYRSNISPIWFALSLGIGILSFFIFGFSGIVAGIVGGVLMFLLFVLVVIGLWFRVKYEVTEKGIYIRGIVNEIRVPFDRITCIVFRDSVFTSDMVDGLSYRRVGLKGKNETPFIFISPKDEDGFIESILKANRSIKVEDERKNL